MRTMFKIMAEKLRAGESLVTVSVVASSGSTPRGAGARMLIGKDGRIAGTVGGGAVEFRSEKIAAEMLAGKTSGEYDFSLTKDDVQNLGMICGGDVQLFFSYIDAADSEAAAVLTEAEKRFAADEDIWLVSDLKNDGRFGVWSPREGLFGLNLTEDIAALADKRPVRCRENGADIYIEQIGFSGKVYTFGGGHVAQELVPVLTHVGFKCIVLDDRAEFTDKSLFPDAHDVRMIDFNDDSTYAEICENDYVCVMTRGHAFDTVVQAKVLKKPACYIGVIGSARKTAGVCKILREQYGFSEKDFDRITTPIGLKIKAETPAEIAISIAAQMIEVRAERSEQPPTPAAR